MINKNSENRDKWFARFMCILIACCLWLYVMSEQNPIVEKEYAIPLVSRNLTEGMIVFNLPEKVSVRVRGTRTALANMPVSDIFAYVNLSKLSVGTHHAMARHNYANRVPTYRAAHSLRRVDFQSFGYLAVGQGLPKRNIAHGLQNRLAKRRESLHAIGRREIGLAA